VPKFSAGLVSYSDLGTNIDLTSAISNIESIIESKKEKILIYDYNLNKIELNLRKPREIHEVFLFDVAHN
jgi:hypothetical protein